MLRRIVCPNCNRMFRPKRVDAKFCTPECRLATTSGARKPAEWLEEVPVMDDFEHEVVMAAITDEAFEEMATDVVYRRAALVRSARQKWEREHGTVVCVEDNEDDGY